MMTRMMKTVSLNADTKVVYSKVSVSLLASFALLAFGLIINQQWCHPDVDEEEYDEDAAPGDEDEEEGEEDEEENEEEEEEDLSGEVS